MKPASMLIASIRRDGGTQIRAALDEATVTHYAAIGTALPPVRVFYDGKDYWLSDGFHRVEAALRSGRKRIDAEIKKGTRRDAILDAVGANATHGLPRSNADKRRAVETLLADSEWSQMPDRALAKLACVSHTYVSEVREKYQLTQREVGNVYSRDAAKVEGQVPVRIRPAGEESSAVGNGKAGPAIQADAGMASGNGDEGAGASLQAVRNVPPVAPVAAAAPAPDEPRDRLINVERMLRDAQAEIAPLLAKGEAMAVQAALDEALRTVRCALTPPAAREYGAVVVKNGVAQLNHTAEAMAADARAAKARTLRVELVDEGGHSEPFEDAEGGPAW